jgi:hypothetical protein
MQCHAIGGLDLKWAVAVGKWTASVKTIENVTKPSRTAKAIKDTVD